jgi:ribosomal protein S18 acetylase RimI-like enzyme
MKIRRLRLSDVEETSALLRKNILDLKRHYTSKERRTEIKEYSVENMQKNIKSWYVKVAEENGRVVGVIVCTFIGQPGLCWLNWVVVKKSYRRRGIGSMLVKSLEKPANDRWNRIRCRTRMSNGPSINMFKKLGYRKVATIHRRIRKRYAYTWEKILNSHT